MEKWLERWKSWLWFASGALILLAILCLLANTQIKNGSSNNFKSKTLRPNPSQWLVFKPMEGNNVWSEEEGELELDEESKISVLKAAIELTASKSFNVSASNNDEAKQKKRARRSANKGSNNERQTKKTKRAFRNERKPILNDFSFPANLVQGMRFVLMCQVLDGDSPIQIKWFKDKQELNELGKLDEQVELLQNDELGSSLLFRRVLHKHTGNYTCTATNHFGSTSYSSFMSVKVPPSWKVEPADKESILGEQIVIDCQASGNPNPFIRWKFASSLNNNQQHLFSASLGPLALSSDQLEGQSFKLINSNHHVQTLENGSLAIRAASKDHEGFYLCEADNGVEPNLVKVLKLLVHLQAQFVDDIQVLDIHHSQLVQQNALMMVANGDQTAKPSLINGPISIGAAKVARVMQNASQIRLLCQPFGELPLTVSWLKDGQLIYTHSTQSDLSSLNSPGSAFNQIQQPVRYHVNTRRSQQKPANGLESELLLTAVRRADAGLFGCAARNAFGQTERKLRLVVQEQPEAPEVVDVAHISSRSISLRWLAPFDGNSPISKYIVEYRKHSGPLTSPDSADWSANVAVSEKTLVVKSADSSQFEQNQQQQQQQAQVQHTVHELEPLTLYSMRVFAINAVGKSRPSVALNLRTEEEVPSVIAESLEAQVLSSKSIKLHWTISHSPEREIIDGFFVGYRSFDTSQNEPQSTLSSVPKQTSNEPTFTYRTIRLTNQPQLKSANQVAQQDQSAYLSPISSLTKSLPSQQVVVVSKFEYLIAGLERNTEYTILIQCFNKKGAGPTSEPLVFKTFINDPPEKLILSADEVSESSAKLSWRFLSTDSLQPKDLLDGFVLTFSKLTPPKLFKYDSSKSEYLSQQDRFANPAARISSANPKQQILAPDQWQAVQLAPQQRNHQLKNLECGSSYAMKIWAFNKIGNGEPSDLVTVNTRGKAPVPPDRRSFIAANSSQARLHLSAWYDGGCEIDKFVVQYRVRGQDEWILVSNNILKEQTSVLIRDLTPATSYELLVSAQNQVGPTEVKYRFTTLDMNGKQALIGNSSPNDDDESADENEADYTNDGTRREVWSSGNFAYRWLLMFKHLLNSPLALVLSLSFFVMLLLVLLFYKFNNQSADSNLVSSSSSSNNNCKSTTGNLRRLSTDNGANSIADNEAMLNNGSLIESPRLQRVPFPNADCHYQSFCAPPTQLQPQPQPDDYSGYAGTCNPQPSGYAAPYGNPSAVHRSATMDDSSNQRQCLMQMLMLGSQQQPEEQQVGADYVTAALTTMARGKRIQQQHQPAYFSPSATLSRDNYLQSVDYQPIQQQSSGCPSGKQLTGEDELSLVPLLRFNNQVVSPNNNNSSANNSQQNYTAKPLNQAFPMSTFKRHNELMDQSLITNYEASSASNSTATTSGCGTSANSSSGLEMLSNDQQQALQLIDAHTISNDGYLSDERLFTNGVNFTQQERNFDENNCDNSSQYDVPFKFNKSNKKKKKSKNGSGSIIDGKETIID